MGQLSHHQDYSRVPTTIQAEKCLPFTKDDKIKSLNLIIKGGFRDLYNFNIQPFNYYRGFIPQFESL